MKNAWILVAALVGCAESPKPAQVVTSSVVITASVRPAERATMAITIDDLPWVGAVQPGESKLDATDRMLGHLEERKIEATGFVVCGHAVGAGEDAVQRWRARGMTLGNHTQWHKSIDDQAAERWCADLGACHDALERWGALEEQRFFRFPYLRRGATAKLRDASQAALADLGYTLAPITVNLFDWHFASGYGRAVEAGQSARAREIAEAYVAFAVEATRRAQETARRKAKRDVAHVLLLHANLLAADHLGALLDALSAEGVDFVPLAEALKDPIYAQPSVYKGKRGYSWLFRVAPVDEVDLARARSTDSSISKRYGK